MRIVILALLIVLLTSCDLFSPSPERAQRSPQNDMSAASANVQAGRVRRVCELDKAVPLDSFSELAIDGVATSQTEDGLYYVLIVGHNFGSKQNLLCSPTLQIWNGSSYVDVRYEWVVLLIDDETKPVACEQVFPDEQFKLGFILKDAPKDPTLYTMRSAIGQANLQKRTFTCRDERN